MRYEIAVGIDAPTDRVWDVLNDVVRWSEWSPTIEEVSRLDDGPFGTGSTARVTQPKMRPMIWTVTQDEPGRSFVWVTKTAGCIITAGHYIADVDGKVRVELTFEIVGALASVLTLMAGRRIRHYVDLEGENLKRHCESRHSQHS